MKTNPPSEAESFEYTFNYEYTYTFAHDDEIRNVEKNMAQNRKIDGDTSGSEKVFYYGARFYRDTGSADNSIPASNPYLIPQVSLQFDKVNSENFTKNNPNILELKSKFNPFPNVEIIWDTIGVTVIEGQIPLEPGYIYTFSAELEIIPELVTEFYHYESLKIWENIFKDGK